MTGKVRFALVATCVLVLFAALFLGSSEPALAEGASLMGGSPAGQDLPALPLGQLVGAQTSSEAPAAFQFSAESAGFLTVVVRGNDEADLTILITDEVGFPLRGGTADVDINGDLSAEQLTVVVPRAGIFQVYVNTMYGSSSLNIGGTWIPYPDVATEPDPDGHPHSATALVPGAPIEGSVDGTAGDLMDWYTVTSETDGMVTVIVEAPEGDLALEVYKEDEYRQYLDASDQDMQGVPGNESLTSPIEAGQTLYFKVFPLFEGEGLIAYKVRAGVM